MNQATLGIDHGQLHQPRATGRALAEADFHASDVVFAQGIECCYKTGTRKPAARAPQPL